MTKRKLIAQLRECAQDMARKPINMYRSKYVAARIMACRFRSEDEIDIFIKFSDGTILLLLLLADMLEAEHG